MMLYIATLSRSIAREASNLVSDASPIHGPHHGIGKRGQGPQQGASRGGLKFAHPSAGEKRQGAPVLSSCKGITPKSQSLCIY